MAPTRRKQHGAVIPFKSDYDETALEYIKHRRSETVNNVTEEISEMLFKLTDDATPFLILRFFSTFKHVRQTMQWTTGPKLFQKFRVHLSDTHLSTWSALNAGVHETVANFDSGIFEFKTTLLTGYKYYDQMDYLRNMKKPPTMSPGEFLLAFRASEARACQLPDAPLADAGFQEIERRRIYYSAMPYAWTEKFDDANMTVEDETLGDMRAYFDKLHIRDPYEPRKSNDNQKGNSTSGNKNKSGSNQSSGNRSNRRNNNNNQSRNNSGSNSNNQGQGRRIQSGDPCPLPNHQGHTWGECRMNHYNDSRQRDRQGSNRGNSGSSASRHDSHAMEQRQGQQRSQQAQGSNESSETSGSGNPNQGEGYYSESFLMEQSTYCQPCSDPESFFANGSIEEAFEVHSLEASPGDVTHSPLPNVCLLYTSPSPRDS